MKLKYALFDLDMTLIDSIIPLMTSANLVAREFGLPEVNYDQVYQAETAQPNCTFESLWTDLWGHYDPKWYEAYKDHMSEAEYETMRLYPTGMETLRTLDEMGVVIGLASNRDYPRKALKSLGIEHFFAAVVGQFDVKAPKPDPEMILKAASLLNAPLAELLYICDSRGDMKAAAAAKVKAFGLTTGGHCAEELKALGAWKAGDELIEVVELFKL